MASKEFAGVHAMFEKLAQEHPTVQRRALRKAATIMQNAIKARAPVRSGEYSRGGELKPGELAASIKQHIHVPSVEAILADKPCGFVIAPEGNLYGLAVAIEHGHRSLRGAKHGPQTEHKPTPAHPFIRPAFDATVGESEAVYLDSMVEEIEKATK